jgi:8-oxo-dGTP pyrophosphatase MutT (NUDIX family)
MTPMPTHAGCVAFRREPDQIRFLIVSSSNQRHWVLPKGHLEPGETLQAAALRELREEAGIGGEIIARLSIQQWRKPTEAVTIQYFLVRAGQALKAEENRRIRWEPQAQALSLLSFEDARSALREAAAAIPPGETTE